MSRERQPSVPGLPGTRLPPPDSLPPTERVLSEVANLEGRLLARFADLDERLDRIEERHGATDEDVRAMREDLHGIRTDVSKLVGELLRAKEVDLEHERDIGKIKTELVAAGAGAGARRGAVAGLGTAGLAIAAKYLVKKLFGVDLPLP